MTRCDDGGARDGWRGCGHRVRVKTLDVVVARENAEGEGASTTGEETVRLRIGMKDLGARDDGEGEDGGEDGDGTDESPEVDPYFFDEGYSVAASTGFARVWEGAEALSSFLTRAPERCRGKRVVELGAGVGECGLVAACLGAHVCLTDVRAVVQNVIRRNVEQNGDGEATTREAWPDSTRVGRGSATRATLDWCEPIPEHPFGTSTTVGFRDADLIIAAECVWLRELLPPFAATAATLLTNGVPEMILSVRDRSSTEDASSGKAFAHTNEVVREFENAGCALTTLHRQPAEDDGKDIVVFHIRAADDGSIE